MAFEGTLVVDSNGIEFSTLETTVVDTATIATNHTAICADFQSITIVEKESVIIHIRSDNIG